MRLPSKALFIIQFLIIGLLFTFSFNIATAPVFVVYFLAVALFLVALVAPNITTDFSGLSPPLLIIITLLPIMLLVVDPVEIGLVGHDAYLTLDTVSGFTIFDSPSEFTDYFLSYPGYAGFIHTISVIVDIQIQSLGKYVNLLVAAFPIFYYLSLKPYVGFEASYYTAIGIGSLQNFLFFHPRFIDETLAILLLASLIFSLMMKNRLGKQKFTLVAVITSMSLVLTHHLTAVISVIFFLTWTTAVNLGAVSSRLFNVVSKRPQITPIFAVLFSAITILTMLYITYPSTESILRVAIISIFEAGVSSTEQSVGISSNSLTWRTLISKTSNRVSIILFVLIGFIAVVGRTKMEPWEFGWATFGGGLAFVFVVMLVIGNVIDLEPFRLYPFFMTSLIAVSISYLFKHRGRAPKVILYGVLCILIVGQVLSVGPHLMKSDTAKGSLSGGHYSAQEHTAADTVPTIQTRTIVGYERELWEILAKKEFEFTTQDSRIECSKKAYVWRGVYRDRNIGRETIEQANDKWYSSGGVSISNCA